MNGTDELALRVLSAPFRERAERIAKRVNAAGLASVTVDAVAMALAVAAAVAPAGVDIGHAVDRLWPPERPGG